MPVHYASRTLVKSPPELWAQCSDTPSLARLLGEFGEICITRLEPETVVAWEGKDTHGTVTLEPTGWGTKVTLIAVADDEDHPPRAPEPRPPPSAADGSQGLWARLKMRFGGEDATQVVEPVVPAEPSPVPEAIVPDPAELALTQALDSLGQPHRRPFSRR